MKRWPYIPLALTLAAAVAVVCCPRWPEPAEPDVPPQAEFFEALVPEAMALRIRAKHLIAREVAAGRRGLVEAAALFGALNRLPPKSVELPNLDAIDASLRLPKRTDAERLCWLVIAHVKAVLNEEPPDRVAAVVARLEAEFWEELRRHGVLRLPDPSTLPSAQELLERAQKAMTETERKAPLSLRQDAPER
jgi:hypothetical protein